MYNYTFYKETLGEITKALFREVIRIALQSEMTSVTPLGGTGDDFVLHGSVDNGRKSAVTIRSYGGDPELLITDQIGGFLFYGRFHASLGVEFLTDYYWDIFTKLTPSILSSVKRDVVRVSPNATKTIPLAAFI